MSHIHNVKCCLGFWLEQVGRACASFKNGTWVIFSYILG